MDNLICDSIDADILIFGSSRAHQQYYPKIFMDSLNMSCYNCGSSGMGILYHYGRWRMISKRHIPRVVVYDVLPVLDMMVRDDNVIFINPLRRYYGKDSLVDRLFYEVDSNERLKMLSNTYRYHSSIMGLVSDYRNATVYEDGFEVVTAKMPKDDALAVTEKVDYEVDSLKLQYLEQFILETKDKIKLIFVASPRWGYQTSGKAFEPLLELCAKYNIPFIDHYCDSTFNTNPELFSNESHMNVYGADVWSKEIASEIKKLLIFN
ncbi:MAG: hypothetical protein MJY95_03380 [Bacteroidaceae bacterium]|nr:hypothetical protein [Bacteroidaceae bacterium]